MLTRWLLLGLVCLSMHEAEAFLIDGSIPKGGGTPGRCAPRADDDFASSSRQAALALGYPAHETMTRASIKLAAEGRTTTRVAAEALDAFLSAPASARRTILACCRYVATSSYCRCLDPSERRAEMADPEPIVTGSRWPDDPCHLLARGDTALIWGRWLVGGASRGNNLFYLSHFHDFAFMHAMAPSGPADARSIESTATTRRKILTWMEFAFRVASGEIAGSATFAQAQRVMSPDAAPVFERMFPGFVRSPKQWSIEFFLLGVPNADPLHVRQLALGALLHTLQDAYSDSHVRREGRVRPSVVTGAGPVVQYLDYKQQSRFFRHPAADAPPADLLGPTSPASHHPVALGAEIIACAAQSAGSPGGTAWDCAAPFASRPFEPAAKQERLAGPGDRYR